MSTRQRCFRGFLVSFLALAVVFALAGQRLEQETTADAALFENQPGADAEQLWQYITKLSPYKSWRTLPRMTNPLRVTEIPHGDWVGIYVNDEAYDSIANQSNPFKMKYGSILIKENYVLNKKYPKEPPIKQNLVSITVMYKVKGYHTRADQEEWFWVMYECKYGECDGSVATISNQPWLPLTMPKSRDSFAFFKGEVMAGKPWLCLECHQRAITPNAFAVGDYVWKLKPFAPK
jgi:hypothetical protein